MSQNIEDQIVSMKFDNKQFESGVSTSMGTLDKLKSSLAFPDAGKGLAEVNKAASRFNLNPMSSAVQGVSKTWLAMTTVALTAISNITNKAVDAGLRLAKSFTIDPITAGFKEYEKNLNSTQTIMANTGKSVNTVNKYLQDLNRYSDQTIYNFGQMADSIGKFTAAGVPLKEATASIKGLANTAALSGSDVNQLNTAMYQMSQALSTGTIRLMDWNSLANAGMGGENIRMALQATERTFKDNGAAMDAAITKFGSFRDSLQSGWLDADTFNKTMTVMAGKVGEGGKTVAFTVQELKKMGYSAKAAKDLNKLSSAAINSATKVKTFSQALDVVRESIGSGWSKLFQDLFGNFTEATKLWTNVTNTITGAVGTVFGAVDKILVGWRKLGGFQELWATFGNIFKTIGNLLSPLVSAFREIFPATGDAGKGLYTFTHAIYLASVFIEKLTEPIANLTIHLDFLRKAFGFVGDLISNLFSGFDSSAVDKVGESFGRVADRLSPLEALFHGIVNAVQTVIEAMKPLVDKVAEAFGKIGDAIAKSMSTGSFNAVFDVINTALLGGIVLLLKKFFDHGLKLDFGGGLMGGIKESFGQLTDTMKAMQTQIQAKTLLLIAGAIALLTTSVVALSLIDSAALTKALTAMAVGFGQLLISMGILTKISGSAGFVKTPIIAASLMILAGAMLVLATAVKILSTLDWNELSRGLAGLSAILVVISAASVPLSANAGGMIRAGLGVTALAVGINILAAALKIFATISWKEMGRGLVAMAGALLIVTAAASAIPASIIVTGPGLIAFAAGVAILAEALDLMGKNDAKTITKGLLAMAGALAIVAIAVGLIPASIVLIGPGLIAVSIALNIMAGALKIMGGMGWGAIKKGLVTLGASLLILASGLYLMTGSLAGSAALLVAAAALAVLTPVLVTLGSLSWTSIVKGLTAIAGVFLVLGVAGLVLTPLVPALLGLGAALLLVGLGLGLAGAGALAFATAFSIFAAAGTAGVAVVAKLIALVPQFLAAFALGLVDFLTTLANSSTKLTEAFVKLVGAMIDGLITLVPKAGKLIRSVINEIIRTVAESQLRIYKAAINFLLGFLNAATDSAPKFIKKGADLIIAVITGLGKQGVRIANATGQAILDFLDGLDKAIVKYEGPIIAKGAEIAKHLVEGMVQGIQDGVGAVGDAAQNLAESALDKIKHPWEIFSPSHATRRYGNYFGEGAALGIKDKHKAVEKESEEMANKALGALAYTFKNSRGKASGLMDLQPKITPILDLAQLEKDASQISAKMGSHSIKANLSRNVARDIAGEHAARHASGGLEHGGDTYEFVQNNYSPEPINHVKAYRGTKSQIALFKEVTGK